MAFSLSRALNIEREERNVVFLLLAQSIFLGIFAGALDVGANALFLDAYSADLMPRAFMISGAVGIIFTSFYTFLQNRLRFKLFTILNLIIAILLTGALRVGYAITDDPRLAFAVLVMMGPLIIISMLGFWGTAGRYFTLREGKRLFGVIDTGSVIGMILAFYAVPVLVRFNFKVSDTLLIGLSGLILALVLQIVVLGKHKLLEVKSLHKEKKRTGIIGVFRKRYTSLMALFIVLSVVTAFFIHYSFMWTTEANYPDSRELTSFLGAFFGTMMIFTVILKSTLYGWLMKNYGLRVTLLISPVLLLLLTVVASAVGGFFGFGPESASFTLFFLAIALSKLFNKSLKDAIESPSMKILYQSLGAEERFDIQAKIDGIVNELTAFAAGVIMAGLLLMSFINVIHFSYILIFILVAWVILGFALYKSYRKKLNDTLASTKTVDIASKKGDKTIKYRLNSAPMFSDLIALDPYFYHFAKDSDIREILQSEDERKQNFLIRYLKDKQYNFDETLIRSIHKKTNDLQLKEIIDHILEKQSFSTSDAENAFRSGEKKGVLAALKQTIMKQDKEQIPHIITLLRDRDIEIRAAAIETAGKINAKELGSYLVDYLGHPELYSVTWHAMVNMGEMILENLENAFHKSGTIVKVQLRIVRAMAHIGGTKANKLLFQKIEYHQRSIREEAIEALFDSDFQPNEMELPKLQSAIYDAVLAGSVYIAAEATGRENDPGNGLMETIIEEKFKIDRLIFKLLGIAYDKSAVSHVEGSFMDQENLDVGYALELLNMIVDDQVFDYLEPYFDEISVQDKIKRLQSEMPVEILNYEDMLVDLINRDSLYAGNYIRVCAIDAIGKIVDIQASKYLAAQLFHPHPAISGAASVVLNLKDPSLHQDIIERLDTESGNETSEGFVRGHISGKRTIALVENIKQWKTFMGLERDVVLKLVHSFVHREQHDLESEHRVSILKTQSSDDQLIFDGVVILLKDYPKLMEHIRYIATLPDLELFQIDLSVFRELMFDQKELRKLCIDYFSSENTQAIFNAKVK